MTEQVTFEKAIGETITDAKTNVHGTVKAQVRDRYNMGYWIEAVDSTGRPFEHFIDERDVV